MAFFDQVIDPRWLTQQRAFSRDPWLAPPGNVVPARAADRGVFVRTNDIAVWLSLGDLYADGLALALNVRWRTPRQVRTPLIPGDRGRNGLCLGAEFADGLRRLAVSRKALAPGSKPSPPTLLVTSWTAQEWQATAALWLWPLPERPVTWVVEWRSQRIAETHWVMDVEPLLSQVNQAEALWPLEGSAEFART